MRLFLFFFLSTALFATEELKWTPSEMMKVKNVADVRISPDGKSALYVVSEARMEDNKYFPRIYKSKIGGEPEFLAPENIPCIIPRWSPDGKQIAFLEHASGGTKIHLVDADGGEPSVLFESKNPILLFAWSPDSQKIAYVMVDSNSIASKEISFLYDQENVKKGIWILDVADSTSKAVTTDDYFVRCAGDFGTLPNQEFDWSPDGNEITFAYSVSNGFEAQYLSSSLATFYLDTGRIVPWEKKGQFESMPRYSPDGKWISYLSSGEKRKYDLVQFLAVQSRDGKERRRLASTPDGGPFLTGPNHLGWTSDSSRLVFFEPKRTKFQLVLVPVSGAPAEEVDSGDTFFIAPSLNADSTWVGFTAQSTDHPPEAFASKLESFKPVPISRVNDPFLLYPKIKTEIVRWKSSDGREIEGLLSYPVGFEGQKVPLLLVVHGGPMGFFNETFLGLSSVYPIAAFANEGYAVLRPNPRGSCGYGKEFQWMNYRDWGGKDFEDLMTGVDSLVDRGIADPERLGVMGFSYGGYMTAWTITQTARFKAASMGAGLTNLTSMANTTDLLSFLENYFGDEFWKDPKIYHDRSPIYYVENIATPCLIQHGINDLRVPVSQSYEFCNALKKGNKQAALYLYPRMGHHTNEPKQVLDLMEKNLDWFNEFLMERF